MNKYIPFAVAFALLYSFSSVCYGQLFQPHSSNQPVPLAAHAGGDSLICELQVLTLGATSSATDGTPPYTYNWSPTTFLSSSTVANPQLIAATVGTHTYILEVTDAENCTRYDTVIVEVDACAGIGTANNRLNAKVYPNPSKDGLFTLAFSGNNTTTITINVIALVGNTVFSEKTIGNDNKQYQLDLSHLSKGAYLLQIISPESKVNKNIIIR